MNIVELLSTENSLFVLKSCSMSSMYIACYKFEPEWSSGFFTMLSPKTQGPFSRLTCLALLSCSEVCSFLLVSKFCCDIKHACCTPFHWGVSDINISVFWGWCKRGDIRNSCLRDLLHSLVSFVPSSTCFCRFWKWCFLHFLARWRACYHFWWKEPFGCPTFLHFYFSFEASANLVLTITIFHAQNAPTLVIRKRALPPR